MFFSKRNLDDAITYSGLSGIQYRKAESLFDLSEIQDAQGDSTRAHVSFMKAIESEDLGDALVEISNECVAPKSWHGFW